MDSDGRGLGRDQVDVGEFPSSNSPSWRLWLLEFLSTANQLKWNYQKCCQKISESLVAAVFNAFLEAKLSVEVETGDPSVIDVLSRTLAVIGFTQMENLEETFLHQTQQRTDENIFVYARRVGAIKTLALKERGNEYWVAICAAGLTDKCLRDVAEQPGIAASIGRELEPQDSFLSQLDVLWSKMHQVRLFDAEAQAHEEELTTDQEHSRVVQGDERFQNFRLLTKEKQTGNVADAKGSNAAQCENEETKSKSIAHTNTGRVARSTTAWKASYWGCEDSDENSDEEVDDMFWLSSPGPPVTIKSTGVDQRIMEFPEETDPPNRNQCKVGERRAEIEIKSQRLNCSLPEAATESTRRGRENLENVSDKLLSMEECTDLMHVPGTQPWGACSDEEWSDEETDEFWEESESDDDFFCPYEPLTLEESLRQIEDGRKAPLAIRKSEDPTFRTSGCSSMSSPAVAKCANGDSECLPDLDAKSGEIRVVPVHMEYRIQLSDQKSPVHESRDIMAEIVAVHSRAEAVPTETKAAEVARVDVSRANMTLERCFSIMMQPCVVEVGIGRVSNQSANRVWRLVLELVPLKVPKVQRSSQYWKWAKRVDDKKPTRETLTLASFRRKKRKKQEPWVPRDVKHKLSWSQPEELRVNGQDEPAGVELRVASDTDISKRQQLTVSWWLWTAWMLMMARLLILESYSLSNRTSTPITTLWSMVLPSSERWSPSELRRRAEGWLLRNDQTFNEHGWSVTQWRSDETPTFFEYSDRSWIRWKVIPEVGRDYQKALEKQNATSKSSAKVADILWESDALAVNEFRNELRLVPQRAEHVGGVHGKLSWESMPSKSTVSTTLRKITRPAKKSDGQNSIWDSGGAMFKRLGFRTMSTPEGKWVRHPQPAWNTQKRPAARRVRDSGQRNGNMERKQSVAVPSDDSCSWISHRKHGRWKTKEYAAQNSMKKMTHRVTTMCSEDASPRDCEMSIENW